VSCWSPFQCKQTQSPGSSGTSKRSRCSSGTLRRVIPLAWEVTPNDLELLDAVVPVVGRVTIQISESIEELLIAVSWSFAGIYQVVDACEVPQDPGDKSGFTHSNWPSSE
jgi:hypothetical protein